MDDKSFTLEFLKEQLERTNYWLSFAEAKNGALVAINLATMAVIVELRSDEPVFCTIVLILLIFSSIVCLTSFFPNLKTHSENPKFNEDDSNLNILFYSDIAKLSEEQYIKKIVTNYGNELDEETLDKTIAKDYMSEVHINSCIAHRKFIMFKRAIKIDILALVLCILFFIAAAVL